MLPFIVANIATLRRLRAAGRSGALLLSATCAAAPTLGCVLLLVRCRRRVASMWPVRTGAAALTRARIATRFGTRVHTQHRATVMCCCCCCAAYPILVSTPPHRTRCTLRVIRVLACLTRCAALPFMVIIGAISRWLVSARRGDSPLLLTICAAAATCGCTPLLVSCCWRAALTRAALTGAAALVRTRVSTRVCARAHTLRCAIAT